ncbi:MAG: class I SAM-dependent methyltransferase [Burkholderiaceae bacterium]
MSASACPCCCTPTLAGQACTGCHLRPDASGRLWRQPGPHAAPAGFDDAAASRLADLDASQHFWMSHRLALIRRLLEHRHRERGKPWRRVLELGCGAGAALPLLESYAHDVTAVDGHGHLLERARDRSATARLIEGDVTDTGLPAGQHDLICAFDVLEHVDPDRFLGEARRLATDDADLLLSVPAGQYLWSRMDEEAGHRCRYDPPMLRGELARNGWSPGRRTHYQMLLLPLLYVSRRWARAQTHASRERAPAPWVATLLGEINRAEVGLFHRLNLPMGSSLFMWAQAETPSK